MSVLTPEQLDALHKADAPFRVQDPATNTNYVLVREDVYERFRSLFEEDPPTREEQSAFLGHFAEISGWDDPELDVYNDMK
jgi:hypothetical protein